MRIFKWIAAVVLLTGLTVSTASAATYYVDYLGSTAASPYTMTVNNWYLAQDPSGNSVVNLSTSGSFTHDYYFNVTDISGGLSADTIISVVVGASWINNLTFEWDTSGPVVASDGSGNSTGLTNFTRYLANGLHKLTVTGFAVVNTNQAAYDFSIHSVPIPAAFWLFGSALVAFFGFGRRSAA